MVSLFASGTQSATVTTEHFLSSPNVAGKFVLYVDLVNMVAGDVVELRAYKMVLTGGTQRVMDFVQFAGPQPTDALIAISAPVPNTLTDTNAVRFSLKQTFGTSRNFPWAVLNEEDFPANFTLFSIDGNGRVDVSELAGDAQSLTDLKDFADAGYDPATNKVEGVKLADTLTTYTGNTPQTGDSFARLGAPAGASVSVDVAAVRNRLSTLVTKTATVQIDGGNSATQFKTDLTETTNDHYKDCLVKITSGTLAEQVKKCTGYNGTTKILSFTSGYTGTPADGVTVEIVNE